MIEMVSNRGTSARHSIKRAIVLAMLLLGACGPVSAAERAITIGEISSYSALPSGTEGYRKGWQLAVEEINKAGGINGREFRVISRDDAGKPDVAITQANELIVRQEVDILTGTILSNVGLAVADVAKQRRMFFLAAQPLTDALVWEKGNRYTFRLRPSTFTQAMILAEEAAKIPAKRWATIAPNYEFGQAAVANFKAELKKLRPDVEFVSEQWPPLGKLEAGAVVQALAASRPEAIFNVTFGPDLVKFVREGTTRGLFNDRAVVSILTGEPEYLDPLKDETPKGWIVTGYPWESIITKEHRDFVEAYRARYQDYPRIGSLMGYTTMIALARIVEKAGGTDTEKLIAATKGLVVPTPSGDIVFRSIDHQSTMGVYVGKLDVKDGRGVMVDWRYVDGSKYQPSDETVAKLRPND